MTLTVTPGKAQLETITLERLHEIVADFSSKLGDAQIHAIFSVLFGGEHSLSAFSDTKGLGIGAFAKLVRLPASTVRHYVELGLVRPYIVSGKFRFVAPNYVEIQHVRQWVDLGMKLEEIVTKTRERGANSTTVQFGRGATMTPELEAHLNTETENSVRHFKDNVDQQIQRLEVKQKELNAKLKRAKELKTRLEIKPA